MSDELRGEFKNQVIRASAGTGKTFALSNRFLRLLASGAECESILATTFTRKGAGEILDRIVQRLARAALSESATAELANQLDWSLNQSRVQELLRELIRSLHCLQIGTLDSFFYRIAQSFRLELGLPTQWQIVNEHQIETLHKKIIHEILRDKHVISLLHILTKGEAQRRIADLVRDTVSRLYKFRVESDAAAWDWLKRPKSYSVDRDFSNLIIRLQAINYPHKRQATQINKEISLVENGDWLVLVRSGIFAKVAAGNHSYYKPLPVACVEAYQELIEHCRGIVIDDLIRKNSSTFELLDAFGQRLETEKTETGQLRFTDITVRLEQFILSKPTAEFAFRMDSNVDHLLLDEFQDTSISQWNVIEPFAVRTTQGEAKRSFFCVGDLKQAIYGWRGGVAEIFDAVQNQLPNISESQPLLKSYRSSPLIIDVVNEVFGNLNRFQSDDAVVMQAIGQWSQRFEHHQTARKELPGYFTLEFAGDCDEDDPRRDAVRNENALTETVERIQQLREQVPDRTIGVLVRKNETVGKLIFMLQVAGVAASEEGGNPLTDSAAVELLLSLLSVADHPGDSTARFHVSHSPLAPQLGLVPETIVNQAQNIGNANGCAARIRTELSLFGYGCTIEKYARILAPDCTRRELSRLQQLVQEAFNYDRTNDQTRIILRPCRFVNFVRNEFKASDESSARVRVMTVHQSKGLEFDVVVLPMLYERNGWFTQPPTIVIGRDHPSAPIHLVSRMVKEQHRNLLPDEFQQAVDENRRSVVLDNLSVLYVAMTRAVHAMHIVMSYACKPEKSSSASVVLSTLYPGDRKAGLVYSRGREAWYKEIDTKTLDLATQPDTESRSPSEYYLPHDATLSTVALADGNRTGRGMPNVTPSGLEGGEKIALSSIFAMIENVEQLDRGSAIHACFETIRWLDERVPTRNELESHLSIHAPLGEKSGEWIDHFLRLLEQPTLIELLSRHPYQQKYLAAEVPVFDALRVDVYNERPFAVQINEQFMQGTIDRLVLFSDGDRLVAADIVDYKTDDVDAAGLHLRTQFYRPQLDAYRSAVSAFCKLPLELITSRLVFVESGVVVNLQDDPDLASSVGHHTVSNAKPPNFSCNQQQRLWTDE